MDSRSIALEGDDELEKGDDFSDSGSSYHLSNHENDVIDAHGSPGHLSNHGNDVIDAHGSPDHLPNRENDEYFGFPNFHDAINAMQESRPSQPAQVDENIFGHISPQSTQKRSPIRLTAPAEEIIKRKRTKKASPMQDDVTAQLRAKQMKLVDDQLKLNAVLLENATIAGEEAKERLKMATAQRKLAEIELELKHKEQNSNN